jgi:hypothetical protein
MARPRRPFSGVEEIERAESPFLTHVPGTKIGVRQRMRWEQSTHWTYRQPNGQYDPLTYLHVLDEVANINPDIELRSKNLAEWLNRARDQFVWDAVTVGKVLSDLCEAFEGKLGEHNGLLERGKDFKGAFYRIHHVPAAAELYIRLREDLMRLSEIEMAERGRGNRPPRLVSPLLECASVREEWNEPA